MAVVGDSSGAPAFCGNCGARVQGTRFCQRCGTPLAAEDAPIVALAPEASASEASSPAASPTEPVLQQASVASAPAAADTPPGGTPAVTPSDPALPAHSRPRRGLVIGGVMAAAVVLIGAAVGTTLALSNNSPQGPTYSVQAARYIAPVLTDNKKIDYLVALLKPGGSTSGVTTLITSTQSDTQNAQQNIAGVKATSTSDQSLATELNAALSAETSWLQTAGTVLANPSSPQLSQLSGIGLDAQNKFAALGPTLRAAAKAPFPSSAKVVAFATATDASALANAANTTFSNQVLALLNQSTSAYQAVNTFYSQLQTAADGGYTSLTLPEAEQQITSIVASRTSLAAAAQALNAATPTAQGVSTDLVTAFNDSLKDDNDLANCLNEANNGTEAFIFQDCLSASSSDNAAATADKATFLTAYNALRASVGQPPTNVQF